ncbi:hypothetical protein E2C01_054140 [Portunus trituberculatus]|uniref:Uncharacterized protein n=1 Tax=Portunus trituberculatus TaxID=210409 RepID=A0A5B7GR50_PORTR|nr:hypothetical protein [Portunus trituberculatus]
MDVRRRLELRNEALWNGKMASQGLRKEGRRKEREGAEEYERGGKREESHNGRSYTKEKNCPEGKRYVVSAATKVSQGQATKAHYKTLAANIYDMTGHVSHSCFLECPAWPHSPTRTSSGISIPTSDKFPGTSMTPQEETRQRNRYIVGN